MARGIRYILGRIGQITILTVGSAIFISLCFASLTLAEGEKMHSGEIEEAASPSSIMQILMSPAGAPIDRCLIPQKPPEAQKCRAFFNIDEDVLQNLLKSYPDCLDGHTFYYNFSNQPVIELSKPLEIYGLTENPITISGLRLVPGNSFPNGMPAVVVIGNAVRIKDIFLDGFTNGVFYASADNTNHKLIGGEISGPEGSNLAIEACHNAPDIDGLAVSGFNKKISVIE